ncbi:MAG: ABC transporter ATP-binding protein [Christensenellaceae bacterium]
MKNIFFALKAAWKYEKKVYIYLAIYAIFAAAVPFVHLFFVRWVFQALLNDSSLTEVFLLLISFFIAAVGINFIASWVKRAYQPSLLTIRQSLMHVMQEKSMTTEFVNTENPSFLNETHAAFQTMAINDAGVEGFLHKIFIVFAQSITLIAYFLILGSLNIWILLLLLCNAVASYFVTKKVKNYEVKKQPKINKTEREMNHWVQVMTDISYAKDIRLYSMSKKVLDIFDGHIATRSKINADIWKHKLWALLIEAGLFLIGEGIAYTYLISKVTQQVLNIADFSFYFSLISVFVGTLLAMFGELSTLPKYLNEISIFRNYINKEDAVCKKNIELPALPYVLQLNDVSFRYPGADKDTLKNITLNIPAGQKLGIVGHNGAGKTTLIKLITGLYTPTKGTITLNGIDIANFDKKEYLSVVSAVFQDTHIFAYSVAENIAFAEQADIYAVEQALKKAGIKRMVEELPKGMGTPLGKALSEDGIELSGGQQQRISLARALYKDGAIVVLDEPTAALDPIAEHEIYMHFQEMVKGKTAIFVSHRLASTYFCDKIAMFEQGALIEYGDHQTLLRKNGKYADMFNVQAQYYQEEENVQ